MREIEKLIVKYLNNSISSKEWEELNLWFEQTKDPKIFADYVKTNYVIEEVMREFDTEKTKKKVLQKIEKDKRSVSTLKITKVLKYAAIIVIGILTTTYFFRDYLFKKPGETVPVIAEFNTVKSGTDKAILTLSDGSSVALEKGTSFQTKNANSNGEQIVYKKGEKCSQKTKYNYLTIPRGGQFFIKLSDGTKIWLNSESQLRYPVNFKEGEIRQVELVYGEGYFEVSPAVENGDIKFKVLNRDQEVEVLGTKFNIKAYRDETHIYTTLVEGKVLVNSKERVQRLFPNQQFELNSKTQKFKLREVDVYNEISWKEGVFSFERKSLKEIMVVLSRWYDIEVVFENKSLEDVRFFGVLGKDQKIEEILESIKKLNKIKAYEIKDKKVVLN